VKYWFLGGSALPVALPLAAHWVGQGRGGDHQELRPVRHPPVVLAPRYFVCIAVEVLAADVVVRADLGAAQAGARVKGLLKAELKHRGVTYAQPVDKLTEIGVKETEPNIRNKLARGKFTAVFLVQCLATIGAQSLRLSD
jgi:hypothetical protein